MKELPTEDRPYEKCLQYGPEALQDAELLAVILRTGIRGKSALDLAREILYRSRSETGLLTSHHISIQELTDIPGVGTVKAIQTKCIGELCKRLARTEARRTLSFDAPETIADYYMEILRHEEQEKIFLMMLNTKNQLLGEQCMSMGTANTSVLTPREVLITALQYHAVNLILLHNHPSGDPAPSREDTLLTERIRQAAEIIGLHLLDHIVIGDHRYVSFREAGYLI